MTIEIQLTRGYVAIVDNVDADLAELRWRVAIYKNSITPYAIRDMGGKTVSMHKLILERVLNRVLMPGEKPDHINTNGLVNLRSNLRLSSNSQNMMNRGLNRNNKAGLKGVQLNPSSKKRPWKTAIVIDGKFTPLGTFSQPIDAHRTYCIAALTHYGQFVNFGSNSPFSGYTLADFEKAS